MDNVPSYVIFLSSAKPKTITLVQKDPGSRYKTRQLQIQVQGKSKMIKTVLVNILDVAKDMLVPPNYIGTYMGYVIGAQAKWDPKLPERQQAYLSGEHDPKDLSKIMLQFVNEVLCCPICGLPELSLTADAERGDVMCSCRGCGHKGPLNISDEKFKRYVLNHPPSQNKGDAFAGNKTTKKSKKPKEKSSDEEIKSEKVVEKVEQKREKKPPKKSNNNNEEVVWHSDTSAEAARKRREAALPESLSDVVLQLDDTEELKRILSGSSAEAHLSDYQSRKQLTDAALIKEMFPVLFRSSNILAEVKKHKHLLSRYISTAAGQIALLDCVERFCAENSDSLKDKEPWVFKEFYAEDLVEEETILQWYESGSSVGNVKDLIKPFITWLLEAEEEDSD